MTKIAARFTKSTTRVHNHGPEEGPGLLCKERLIGACQLGALCALNAELVAALNNIADKKRYASDFQPGDGLHYQPITDTERMATTFNALLDAARAALAKTKGVRS